MADTLRMSIYFQERHRVFQDSRITSQPHKKESLSSETQQTKTERGVDDREWSVFNLASEASLMHAYSHVRACVRACACTRARVCMCREKMVQKRLQIMLPHLREIRMKLNLISSRCNPLRVLQGNEVIPREVGHANRLAQSSVATVL